MEGEKVIIKIIFIILGCLLAIIMLAFMIVHLVKKCKKTIQQKINQRLVWITVKNTNNLETDVSFEFQSPVCSICLDELTDTTTQCGHHFHFKCLYLWFKKRLSCPFCQSQNQKDVKIHCYSCKDSYIKLSTSLSAENYIMIESMNKLCKKCKVQKQNISNQPDCVLENISILGIRSSNGGEIRKIIPINELK